MIEIGDKVKIISLKQSDLLEGDLFPKIREYDVYEVDGNLVHFKGSNGIGECFISELDTVERDWESDGDYIYYGYCFNKSEKEIIKMIIMEEFIYEINRKIHTLEEIKYNIENELDDYQE